MKDSIGEKFANMFATIGLSLSPFNSSVYKKSNIYKTSNFLDGQKQDAEKIGEVWAEVGKNLEKIIKK